MDALKCDICGGSLTMDISGEFAICDSCGMKYSKEHVKAKVQEIKGTVSVEGSVKVQSTDFEIRAGVLLKYHGEATDVVIPESVTQIGDGAFEGCSGLTSVVIPEGVTVIGAYAFRKCSSLTDISLPSTVKSLGDAAFDGCDNLHNITIPQSITRIDKGAFSGWSGLSKIDIPDHVTCIGEGAFSYCNNLVSITIPDSVDKIERWSFAFCESLRDITIPKNVKYIGDIAFWHCSLLEKVTILGNPALGIESDSDGYSQYVFDYCDGLTTINASEEWKQANWRHAHCLHTYAPKPSEYKKSGGCYIATAVYGSYNCPQVWTLRRYRDNQLAKHLLGRAFIRCYYAISPHMVKWFGKTKWFQSFWKRRLDKLVCRLKNEGVDDTPYCDKNW